MYCFPCFTSYIQKWPRKRFPQNKCFLKFGKILTHRRKIPAHYNLPKTILNCLNITSVHVNMSSLIKKRDLINLTLSCIYRCRFSYLKLGHIFRYYPIWLMPSECYRSQIIQSCFQLFKSLLQLLHMSFLSNFLLH